MLGSCVHWLLWSIFCNDNYDGCRKIFCDGCGDMFELSEAHLCLLKINGIAEIQGIRPVWEQANPTVITNANKYSIVSIKIIKYPHIWQSFTHPYKSIKSTSTRRGDFHLEFMYFKNDGDAIQGLRTEEWCLQPKYFKMGLFYENRTPPFTKHSIFPLYDNMYKHARERRKKTQIQVIHTWSSEQPLL